MDKHIDRYKPVRRGFWWKVQIGDGEQAIGKCYTEAEAELLAAALQRAFWDGVYIGITDPESGMAIFGDGAKQLGELMREQRKGGPVPHA